MRETAGSPLSTLRPPIYVCLSCVYAMTEESARLRKKILDLSARYFTTAFPAPEFKLGQSHVPVSGNVIDGDDLRSVVDSALDCWFTTGRFAEDFERKLARFVGVRCASLVNSGSSANLLAISVW